MLQKRALGMIENYVNFCSDHARGTTCVVAMLQVSGPLEVELMKQSMALLQKKHPLLRASITRSNDGQDFLQVDKEPVGCPLVVVQRENSGHWKQVYERYLNETIDKGKRYLWRATLLLNKDGKTPEHELVMYFHHTIIDGLSIGALFKDLLHYYEMISSGKVPQIDSLPLLPSVDDLLSPKIKWEEHLKKGQVIFSNLSSIGDHLYPYEQDAPLHQRKSSVEYYETDEEQLTRLVNFCKENGTTLTSLLSAALLIAVHKVKGGKDSAGTRQHLATTPVDVRNQCNPKVGSENIGCFVSAVSTLHLIDMETSLLDLSHSFTTEIRKAVQEQVYATTEFRHKEYTEMLGSLDMGPFGQKYHLGAGVTNYGVLDIPVHSGPLHCKGFYSGAVRHWGDWLTLMHAASVGGKLYCCFCYEKPLLSKKSAEAILQEFVSLLNSAV